jgi:DNA repair protein RecN (Recombination protein N)
MLTELTIRDFAIIDNLTLTFAPGFNVLTGETGAGKSIIMDAVSLILGDRADTTVIRSKAEAAHVEGIFAIADIPAQTYLEGILAREGLEGDALGTLVLAREVRDNGRSICRVNGRMTTLAILKEIGEELVDIHGQSEHLSLLRPATHVNLLDRYGGLEKPRATVAGLAEQVEEVRRELHELLADEEALRRRAELLAYQLEEISVADLQPGEDEALREETRRLASAEQLALHTSEAYDALFESEGRQLSANDLLSIASEALAKLAQIDPALKELADQAAELCVSAEELARSVRTYQKNIEFSPERLQEAEERLTLINSLKRKYGGQSIEDVLAHGARAEQELARIEHSEERTQELREQEASLLAEIGKAGAALSAARKEAAQALAGAVEAELADLNMEGARFEVAMDQTDDPTGAPVGDRTLAFDRTGIDQVEFYIAPNVGEPLHPIARTASGGETSRIMLALKTVLSRADQTPTLVFDEIDAGIGGRIGAIVGEKLWRLANDHQVLVVTHLPQLAGFGDEHFKVEKVIQKGRTLTRVHPLKTEERIAELSEMMGKETAESAQQTTREYLDYVRRIKARG